MSIVHSLLWLHVITRVVTDTPLSTYIVVETRYKYKHIYMYINIYIYRFSTTMYVESGVSVTTGVMI